MPIHSELQTKTEEQNYEELMERLKAAATTSFDLYSLAEKEIWFLNECRETLKKDREYNLERMVMEKFGPDFMFYNLKLDQINQFIEEHIVNWVMCKTNQGFLGLKVEDFLYKLIFDWESKTLKVEQMPYAYE